MSDELTVRLRELAGTAEASPPGSGAEVRATAGRRRRRRRTTAAVAGGCAAAGLAAVLTLNVASHGTEQRPSTAATSRPIATAAPDVTVDLSRRVLTVAGRELPISAGTVRMPTPTGLMTVTVKSRTKVVTGPTIGSPSDAYDLKLSWVLELSPIEASATAEGDGGEVGGAGSTSEATDGTGTSDGTEVTDGAEASDGTGTSDDATEATEGAEATDGADMGGGGPTQSPARRAVWIAAITHNEEAPGNYDATTGWIGLRTTDARWLYERLSQGAVVEIRSTAPTPASTPTPTAITPSTDDGPTVPTARPESPAPG
ncbi:L,D-transpeptidase family protein [Streptomyces sp. NPDC057474]|uniref:L,D-transpeptidase family protein n=1 Tax=Streptomyces sp. NPDC057474 TaxID=3346144 RepID=UPI00368A381F